MTQSAKKHHHLPVFYLSSFKNYSGKVIETKKVEEKILQNHRSPKNTGYEDYQYSLIESLSIHDGEGKKNDFIETEKLKKIDDKGANAINNILSLKNSNWKTDKIIEDLVPFLLSMIFRPPLMLKKNKELVSSIIHKKIDQLNEVPGFTHMTQSINIDAQTNNYALLNMIKLIESSKNFQYFKSLNFIKGVVNSSSEPFEIITGDNPVVINYGQDGPIECFSLALSPDTILFGFNSDLAEPTDDIIAKSMITHNFLVIRQSRYLYSKNSIKNEEVLKFEDEVLRFLKSVPFRRGA